MSGLCECGHRGETHELAASHRCTVHGCGCLNWREVVDDDPTTPVLGPNICPVCRGPARMSLVSDPEGGSWNHWTSTLPALARENSKLERVAEAARLVYREDRDGQDWLRLGDALSALVPNPDPATTENPPGICGLCHQPMPEGEEMFRYHGYSGPCPVPGDVG